jgi:hypothetical protein
MMRRALAASRGLALTICGCLAFACGSLAFACGSGDAGRAPVEIDRVTAATPELEAELREVMATALASSATFVAGGGLGGSLGMAAWISASDQALARQIPKAGGVVTPAVLFLHIELEVPATLRKQFDVRAITARAALPDTEPTPEMLATAARSALEVLELRLALARGEPEAAALLLRAEDPELVLLALEWTRDHPSPLLADAVAGQVGHDDPQVVRLALEVLAEIGEARHASAVVRRVERWPALAREGYRTLAVLGGPDAIGFLRFAAANEDESELRGEAERALDAALASSGEHVASRRHGVDLPRVARGHRQ